MGGIVVGYDGSGCGKAALDEALRLAEGLGDRVVAVFGYLPPGIWGGEIVEHAEAVEERGQKVLEEAKAQAAPTEIEVRLTPNKPSQALVEVADELDARLIVVGSYGDAPLKGAILGSTPYKLLHGAEHPVLVVPARR